MQPFPLAALNEPTFVTSTIASRHGAARAALAIAHKILVAAYHMLAKGIPYRELGEVYLDQLDQSRTAANLKRRLERLGYTVTLQLKEATTAYPPPMRNS
jgi:hypothetical protein